MIATLSHKYASIAVAEAAWSRWDLDWLHESEHRELVRWRAPTRRRQWLAGRWLMKDVVAQHLAICETSFADIAIGSRDATGRGMSPRIAYRGEILPWSCSIAHTEEFAFVGVGAEQSSIGVDCVHLKLLGDEFTSAWFTDWEREFVAAQGSEWAAMIWCFKEACFKCASPAKFQPKRFETTTIGDSQARVEFRDDNSVAEFHVSYGWSARHALAIATIEAA
jgi:4'-phosphopantetheinyl transferase EntD